MAAQQTYELHLTVTPFDEQHIPVFEQICSSLGGKALIIELGRGDERVQPMFTRTIVASGRREARKVTNELAQRLSDALGSAVPAHPDIRNRVETSFSDEDEDGNCWEFKEGGKSAALTRVKIEVPIADADDEIPFKRGEFCGYFEWHALVDDFDIETLITVCQPFSAHVSLNRLKSESSARFVTLRDHTTLERFYARVTALSTAVELSGRKIHRATSEQCIFDTREAMDRGWLSRENYMEDHRPEIVASEGFIRRASLAGGAFMLKGSFAGRIYFTDPRNRIPQDVDWQYLEPIADTAEAAHIFSDWAETVTCTVIDDGLYFVPHSRNIFWRYLDYGMADDFPTTSTDITCVMPDGRAATICVDITFNLPIPLQPVSLNYTPISGGEPIHIPKSVPLALQIAWKLHQSVVSPRYKDLIDLEAFLSHPDCDKAVLETAYNAFEAECDKDKASKKQIIQSIVDGDWDYFSAQHPHMVSWDHSRRFWFSESYAPDDLMAFRKIFAATAERSGLTKLVTRRLE